MNKQTQKINNIVEQAKKAKRNMKINNIKLSLKQTVLKKLQDNQEGQTFELNKAQSCIELEGNFKKERRTPLSNLIINDSKSISHISKPTQKTVTFEEKYTLGQKIGEGAHGVVKKCYLKENNGVFAVKTIKMDIEHIMFLKENFTEIKNLNHKNVIGYKALFLEPSTCSCHLVMDYLPYPDLLNMKIQSQKQLQEIVYQILSTFIYIHSQGICHRDIKPENILYDEQHKTIKIIDFGISKKLTNRNIKKEMLTQTGTLYYRAPEMFEGGGYDERIDLWALGATIYKLMTGSTPFQSEYLSQTINNIIKGNVTFPAKTEEKYSKAARNLVNRLLKRKQERLTANQALMDVWFLNLYKNTDEHTKKLMLKSKGLRMQGYSTITCQQDYIRASTMKDQGANIDQRKTQQLIKKLKSNGQWIQEQTMIFSQQKTFRKVLKI